MMLTAMFHQEKVSVDFFFAETYNRDIKERLMSGCVGHSSRIIRFLKKEPLRTVGGSFFCQLKIEQNRNDAANQRCRCEHKR